MSIPDSRQARLIRLQGLSVQQRAALKRRIGCPGPIEPAHRTRGPLSLAQRRQWFLDGLQPGNPTYNTAIAVRLKGDFDLKRFGQAMREVTKAHNILRTRFVNGAAGPEQIVDADVRIDVKSVNLWGAATPQIEASLREAANVPFDLAALPLLRATCFRVGHHDAALLIVSHHILCDGWSLGVFVKALGTAYAGGLVIPPPIQYLDFVGWERQLAAEPSVARELSWWDAQLTGAPTKRFLPMDRHLPVDESYRGAVLRVELPGDLMASLQRTAALHNTTLFVVLTAGVSLLLQRWSKVDEFMLGTPVANRAREEFEGLIGLFVNTVALRMDLAEVTRVGDFIACARRVVENALAHQRAPFERVVENVFRERSRSRDPLFHVMITYFNEPTRSDIGFPGVDWAPIDFERGYAYRDLTLRFGSLRGRFTVDIEFRTELFERATIEALARDLRVTLRAFGESPGQAPRDLQLELDARGTRSSAPTWAEAGRRLFDSAVRRGLPAAAETGGDGVRRVEPFGNTGWPLVLGAASGRPDFDLGGWFRQNRERIDRLLLLHGAILWRGFNVRDCEELAELTRALGAQIIDDYAEASTPRTRRLTGVFTSTEYPADQTIKLHNECAFLSRWPERLVFCCLRPAATGGATTLGDVRMIARRIDPFVRRELERRGVVYERNFHAGIDLPWQTVYQTGNRLQVEALARHRGFDVHWWHDGVLRTRTRLPVTVLHPRTGDMVWFNSVHMFHVASHAPAVRASLRSQFDQRLPRQAYFGDGGVIPDDFIDHLCAVYGAHARSLNWKAGDLLLLDNLYTAHGREPFMGDRSVVVTLCDPRDTRCKGTRP